MDTARASCRLRRPRLFLESEDDAGERGAGGHDDNDYIEDDDDDDDDAGQSRAA